MRRTTKKLNLSIFQQLNYKQSLIPCFGGFENFINKGGRMARNCIDEATALHFQNFRVSCYMPGDHADCGPSLSDQFRSTNLTPITSDSATFIRPAGQDLVM